MGKLMQLTHRSPIYVPTQLDNVWLLLCSWGYFPLHRHIADLNEEKTSKQEMPVLTEAISVLLSEVSLKEQVIILKESVELIEVDLEVEERPLDNRN